MVNAVEDRGLNKVKNLKNINVLRYPGASSLDIIDHIKPSLRKETAGRTMYCVKHPKKLNFISPQVSVAQILKILMKRLKKLIVT